MKGFDLDQDSAIGNALLDLDKLPKDSELYQSYFQKVFSFVANNFLPQAD